MAGRCVTRGTDAGLVYYPTISRRKTRTEGREHAIVDAALPTCVYMPRSFALWRPGKYTGVSANSGERFTFVSRSFFFRRSRLLRNGMYVREQEREGPAAKSIERVRSKEWRTTQITRGLLWRNGVPDFSTGSEKGKIYFSFPPFHFLLWVSGRGGGWIDFTVLRGENYAYGRCSTVFRLCNSRCSHGQGFCPLWGSFDEATRPPNSYENNERRIMAFIAVVNERFELYYPYWPYCSLISLSYSLSKGNVPFFFTPVPRSPSIVIWYTDVLLQNIMGTVPPVIAHWPLIFSRQGREVLSTF